MSDEATPGTPAETTTQQPEPPFEDVRTDPPTPFHAQPTPLKDDAAQGYAVTEPTVLRVAAEAANSAAERLEQAVAHAQAAQPGIGRQVLNAAVWAATALAVGWGLTKLAEWVEEAQESRERFPRGTQEAEVEQSAQQEAQPA